MTIYYGLLKIELHAVDPEWVVPGHGPVGTKKDVQKELKYFATIRDHLRARIAAGPSPGGAAATNAIAANPIALNSNLGTYADALALAAATA